MNRGDDEEICHSDNGDQESVGEGFWIESILVLLKRKRYLIWPLPVVNFRHIVTILGNGRFMIELLIPNNRLGVGGKISQIQHTIDHIRHEMTRSRSYGRRENSTLTSFTNVQAAAIESAPSSAFFE